MHNENTEGLAGLSDQEFFRRLAEGKPEQSADDDVGSGADPWDDPSWGEAAIDYHKSRGKRVSTVSYAPLQQSRRLCTACAMAWRHWNGTLTGCGGCRS